MSSGIAYAGIHAGERNIHDARSDETLVGIGGIPWNRDKITEE